MKNEMRLQGIGMVEGTEAGKIQVGDILRWNYGSLSRVVAIDFTKTGKTIIVTTEYFDEIKGEFVQGERKMRITRLVNIVASGETKLTGKASYEMIEEAPEAEEVVEIHEDIKIAFKAFINEKQAEAPKNEKVLVTWFDYTLDQSFTKELEDYQLEWLKNQTHIDVEEVDRSGARMKPSKHEVSYRVTNYGTYVEIMLFVEDVANEITLVAQKEGEYKSMEEAEPMIELLRESRNKIEIVEIMAYTG